MSKVLRYLAGAAIMWLTLVACGRVDYSHERKCFNGCDDNGDGDIDRGTVILRGADGQPGRPGMDGRQGEPGEAGARGGSGPGGTQGAPGANGETGPAGANGQNGYSVVFAQLPASEASCPTGGTTLLIAVDLDRDGQLTLIDVGVQSSDICNGAPGDAGVNGQDAPPTAYTVTEIVDPCGDAPGIFDEVFLRMANGTIVASFSDSASGQNTRFSVLVPGNYRTTDGSNCNLTVHSDGSVTW